METDGRALDPELASRLATAAAEASRALGKPAQTRSLATLQKEVVSSARHLREQGLNLLDVLVILRRTITEMAAVQMISAGVLETVLAETSVWAVSEFHRLES